MPCVFKSIILIHVLHLGPRSNTHPYECINCLKKDETIIQFGRKIRELQQRFGHEEGEHYPEKNLSERKGITV